MKYMGSKARFSKEIIQVMLKDTPQDSLYIEPFAGGMNMIADVPLSKRIASDSNVYLIAMFNALSEGWTPPKQVTKEFYMECKKGYHEDHIRGYVGFNCSYSGKWFGGYAGVTETKQGIRDYQLEAYLNVTKQAQKLKGVQFKCSSYLELDIPSNSLVYCDPPYASTTGYSDAINHEEFWEWVREISKKNNVFVSEYNAPDDFDCVWSKVAKSSLSANGKSGSSQLSTEKLFKIKR